MPGRAGGRAERSGGTGRAAEQCGVMRMGDTELGGVVEDRESSPWCAQARTGPGSVSDGQHSGFLAGTKW